MKLCLAVLCAASLSQASCGVFGFAVVAGAAIACPDLFNENVDPLDVKFSDEAELNAEVAAFVSATRDLVNVAIEAETEAKEACLAIGHDIGLSDEDMAPTDGVSGSVVGACGAVSRRIGKILSSGVQLTVTMKPPECSIDASLTASCEGKCSASGGEPSGECKSSCKARASLRATCSPPEVTVEANQNAELAMRLVASLQKNFPRLLRAQISLGKRVIADADALVSVAANLPTIIDKAGDKAVACVGASASMTTFAAASLGVVVDASVDVSVKVGVGG
ncbi:MAG: hypothetical protein JRI68_03725 [Deltaproteobacteria bacterium]|nr:hypothetical protein [Deltaproteobacteria bacterium]